MVVMILERVPSGLRGKLTRWLLEPRAGVFVGNVSAEVRERLWNLSRQKGGRNGAGILIHSSNTEQGFRFQLRRRLARDDRLRGPAIGQKATHKTETIRTPGQVNRGGGTNRVPPPNP